MRRLIAVIVACIFLLPAGAGAALPNDLAVVYARRTDLQSAFAPDGSARTAKLKIVLPTMASWARVYGYKEHPVELAAYAPLAVASAARASRTVIIPAKATKYDFDFSLVTADKVLVIDDASGEVLLADKANELHPIASLSKLMTAAVVLDRGVSMDKLQAITRDDEVGGARLRVDVGSVLTVRQLFDAALIGSANNAASALAASTGLDRDDFATAMNAKAKAMGLGDTHYVDPTGIEPGNVSTAKDIAKLARALFNVQDIKRATTTSRVTMTAGGYTHSFNNTDGLLIDPNNGLYVLGGKTGYLEESMWNLVVKMNDHQHPTLIVVVFGSASQSASAKDAAAAARWVWRNYSWGAGG
jgi:D-alanyl-D-alanine endopeptidase (penicillin-binding protein 7)